MIRITHLKVTRVKLRCLVHVLQQSPWCAHNNVASGHHLALLANLVRCPADYEARGEIMKTANFPQFFECLR